MGIGRGQDWGTTGPLPPDGVVVRTDAEARGVVTEARRAGEEIPPLGLLGGDLCRTVGGRGVEARLRSDQATRLTVDVGAVLVDGRLQWFVAHLVARRSWWWGPIFAACNAQWLGTWDVAPAPIRATAASRWSRPTSAWAIGSPPGVDCRRAPTCPTPTSGSGPGPPSSTTCPVATPSGSTTNAWDRPAPCRSGSSRTRCAS